MFWIGGSVSSGIPDSIGYAHARKHLSEDGVSPVGGVEIVVVGHVDVELGASTIQCWAPGHA